MTGVNQAVQTWLEDFVRSQNGAAGSVHLYETGGLRLAASVNIPPMVQEIVAWVPSGKGMAGLALERGEPVQTCNLQRDAGGGGVMPGAKAVNAQAAIAMPVRDRGGSIIAVPASRSPMKERLPATRSIVWSGRFLPWPL